MTEKKFDDTNRGSIWKREARETDEEGKNYPDFTGSLNVDGRNFYVSAWRRKEGASPKAPALSFQVKPKDMVPTPSKKTVREEMDDDIPY